VNSPIKLSFPPTRDFWEIAVLYEDELLLALDKPAGLLSSPEALEPDRPSLMRLLHTGIADGKPWARERGLSFLMNAHRLDPEVAGVLLLAKTKPTLATLADQFSSGKSSLSCLALVQGIPAQDRFEVDAKLATHPLRPSETVVDSRGGKQAHTRFEVVERFDRWTLVKCEVLIHRPHQIRVHLKYARLPVVGDSLYGGKPLWLSRLKPSFRLKPHKTERPLLGQAALHAESLTLPHPVTGAPLTITSPLPKDFKVALKYLRMYAVGQDH
jgi:RluA family pseudouridine synthase